MRIKKFAKKPRLGSRTAAQTLTPLLQDVKAIIFRSTLFLLHRSSSRSFELPSSQKSTLWCDLQNKYEVFPSASTFDDTNQDCNRVSYVSKFSSRFTDLGRKFWKEMLEVNLQKWYNVTFCYFVLLGKGSSMKWGKPFSVWWKSEMWTPICHIAGGDNSSSSFVHTVVCHCFVKLTYLDSHIHSLLYLLVFLKICLREVDELK